LSKKLYVPLFTDNKHTSYTIPLAQRICSDGAASAALAQHPQRWRSDGAASAAMAQHLQRWRSTSAAMVQ
jgi:ribosomal protein S27AE